MPAILSDVLPLDTPLTFACSVKGVEYARHWVVRRQAKVPGTEHVIFAAETDLSRLSLGPPMSRSRCDLVCGPDLRPNRYRLVTETAAIQAVFGDGVELVFGDGTRKRLDEPEIDSIAGDNTGQIALLLRLHADELWAAWRGRLFSIAAAAGFGYTVEPVDVRPDGLRRLKSSFNEEITLDQDGWLVELANPMEGAVSIRIDAALPDWIDQKIFGSLPLLSYQPPANRRFSLEDVNIPGPSVSLGATVTIPDGPAPYPGLLFLSGTGTHDRHGIAGLIDIGSHEIVDTMSNHGWLGVRFDTRGAGGTQLGDDFIGAGLSEAINDAKAALTYLLTRPDVSGDGCVLIGHSQGGLVALELAGESDQIRAVVLLAAPGRAIDQVLADQIRNRAVALGLGDEQVALQLVEFRAFVDAVERKGDWDSVSIPERFWSARNSRRWLAEHLARDPSLLIAKVPCPVLICQGGADIQVLVDQDAKALYAAAVAAGRRCSLAVFESLDHLFKASQGRSSVSDYFVQRPVDPGLLSTVAEFLAPFRT